MKRVIITLTVATAILLGAATPAFGTHPTPPPGNEMAAPNAEDCRPGGNSHIVGPWTMMTQGQYEAMLLEDRDVSADAWLPPELVHEGADGELIETWGELAHEAATATWEFCDHNDDGLACVMKQTAPSGAAGWVMAYTILDNHPFPGRGCSRVRTRSRSRRLRLNGRNCDRTASAFEIIRTKPDLAGVFRLKSELAHTSSPSFHKRRRS